MSTIKKYVSGCDISFSIKLPSGKFKFLSFDPTHNGSVFWTDNENIQWGIEHSHLFGVDIELAYEAENGDGEPADVSAGTERKAKAAGKAAATVAKGKAAGGESSPAEKVDDEDAVGESSPAEKVDDEAMEKEGGSAGTELKVVTVSGAEDAIEYLVDNFGVNKRGLKKMDKLVAVAAEHGIVFDGLN